MHLNHTFTCLLLLFSFSLFAQTYIIDSEHSAVQIQIERFGVIDVVGRFKNVQGSFTYDKDNLQKTAANAVIKVESYDANNIGGEAAVKSSVFLDAATYPEIKFTSTSVILKENVHYLKGNLTIHGVTHEIALPLTIKGPLLDLPTKKQSIAFTSAITINRQDYGVNFNSKLSSGVHIIGDDVKITLIILAIAE